MHPKPHCRDNLLLAAFYGLLNAFMLGLMSLFAKLLSGMMGPVEVTFFRNLVSFGAVVLWLWSMREFSSLKTNRPWGHVVRSAIGTGGIVLGAWALAIMPLAETTILLFTAPLFIVALSYPVLGERVGIYRIGAVITGFIGVLIMAAPGADSALPLFGVMLGLAWGFSAGAVDLCLRRLGSTEKTSTTVFYFLLFGLLATGVHLPFAEFAPGAFAAMSLLIILGLGLSGWGSLMSKTQSYRLAPAAYVAPLTYTMIIWTVLFDYLFWDRVPSWNVALGATIIIASNIFILWREYAKKIQSAARALDAP